MANSNSKFTQGMQGPFPRLLLEREEKKTVKKNANAEGPWNALGPI